MVPAWALAVLQNHRAARLHVALQVVLMSATLDSELFARYFGGCPALAAGGRTFPVEHLFLEDVYELTDYRLDAEGPNALRGTSDGAKRRALQKAAGSQQSLLKVRRRRWNPPWDTCGLSWSGAFGDGGILCQRVDRIVLELYLPEQCPAAHITVHLQGFFLVDCAVGSAKCDLGVASGVTKCQLLLAMSMHFGAQMWVICQAGWGDDEAGAGASNPHYNPELYASYSANVRKNLAHLDENRIDYELLEELVTKLAEDPAEGAILLFLPGGSLPLSIQDVLYGLLMKVASLRTLGCACLFRSWSDSQH